MKNEISVYFVSDCCNSDMIFAQTDYGICPDCGEHCEIISQEVSEDSEIDLFTRLFREREGMSVQSAEYARLTQDILRLENALIARGVDTSEILWNLAEAD